MPTKPSKPEFTCDPGQMRDLVLLSSGAPFPRVITVQTVSDQGFVVELSFAVEDGFPVMTRFAVERVPLRWPSPDKAISRKPLTATALRAVKAGVLETAALHHVAALAHLIAPILEAERSGEASVSGRFDYSAADRAGDRVASRKGRPVSDEILRRVSEISRENPFDPRRSIHDELGASLRTASRWIALARERDFTSQEADK